MQRQRDGLVPIGEAFGLVASRRSANLAPGAAGLHPRRSGAPACSASEADPDLGFMARLMALVQPAPQNPGNRLQYKRVNGPFKLYHVCTGDHKLPFGQPPPAAWLGSRPKRYAPKPRARSRRPLECGHWVSRPVVQAASAPAPQPDAAAL